jgi:DNA repair photolyase
MPARLNAMRRAALAGYPVGLMIAPIMPEGNWREAYRLLLRQAASALAGLPNVDLTMELITHRFTPKSKTVLNGWYNASTLDMDESTRAKKRTKFGSLKYVYPAGLMKETREFFREGDCGASAKCSNPLLDLSCRLLSSKYACHQWPHQCQDVGLVRPRVMKEKNFSGSR